MPTTRRRRSRKCKPSIVVSAPLRLYLTWGDWSAALARSKADGTNPWELFSTGDRHRDAWLMIAADAVVDWAAVYPGTRPESWWRWSAPELRRLVGGTYQSLVGAGRCHETGVPYINVDDWHDAPLVESTPALLDRLNLWLPGERARVPASAFHSVPFSFAADLLAAPRGVPDSDNDNDEETSGAQA